MPDSTLPLKSGSGLNTISDSGVAPKSRLDDFQSAHTVFEQLRKGSEQRNAKAASIKGMFDGNPPFNPERQKNAGLKGYPNFNTLEGKAYKAAAKVPYYDLFSSAPQPVEVELDIRDPKLCDQWSRIVSEELQRLLEDSNWFDLNVWKMLDDFVGFGKGYMVWPDTSTFKFKRVAWDRVLFPDKTDVDPDEWDHFGIIWHYNAYDLYRRVRNAQRAGLQGWIPDNIIPAIQLAARYEPSRLSDWMGIQQKLRDHDIATGADCDKVVTGWLFVKEFDGSWSWLIIPLMDVMDSKNTKQLKEKQGFIYKKIGAYKDAKELMASFFFDVDDGSVNGLSGLGKDIYVPMRLKDRLACSEVFNAFMRGSITLQPKSGSARLKASLAQIGNVNVLPEGYDVQQSTILGDIEGALAVNRDMDMRLQANTGIYRPQFEKPPGNPETATAASLRFQQGTVLGNSAVSRFHRQLDGLYSEMYRRLVKSGEKEAIEFRKWCVNRGVPEAALSKVRSVKSYRNFGNGSPFLRQTNMTGLAQMYQEYPEDGKRAFLEDWVAAWSGQQKVDRYVATPQAAGIPDRHVWEATQENAALKEAAPVVWTPEQDDNTHLATHAKALQEALAGVQQGGDPAAVAVFGQGILQHAGIHIGALQKKGRKQQVAAWSKLYQSLGKAVKELTGKVQQMQQQEQMQQQKTQQAMTDQQLAQMELSGKMQLAGLKTQHGIVAKDQKAHQDMVLKQQQAQQDLAIKDAEAASKIRRENVTAAHDIHRNNLTSASKTGKDGAD